MKQFVGFFLIIFFIYCTTSHKKDPYEVLEESIKKLKGQEDSKEDYKKKIPRLGMTKAQVEAWIGPPWKVLVAGDPQNENEQWHYFEDLDHTVPFLVIFFEAGSVVRWN